MTSWNENRELIWNSIPTSSGGDADVVVGQPKLTLARPHEGEGYGDATTIKWPIHVASDGTRMVIIESGSRTRIWNTIPTSSNIASDVILGQSDHTGTSNNRVLRWNSSPRLDFDDADAVWGQSTLTSADP